MLDEALSRDDDTYVLCQSLLRVALHEEDWAGRSTTSAASCSTPTPRSAPSPSSSIGYLVRIHRAIDVSRVLPVLYALQADSYVASRVRDTLEDIRQFAHAA